MQGDRVAATTINQTTGPLDDLEQDGGNGAGGAGAGGGEKLARDALAATGFVDDERDGLGGIGAVDGVGEIDGEGLNGGQGGVELVRDLLHDTTEAGQAL